jgi:succinate dehydrogenase/fumarate reductase cytochrome b subunit
MEPRAQAAFVRGFHKYSGLLLILLVGLKLFSGFEAHQKFGLIPSIQAMRWHTRAWIDLPLTFLFLFHASYGILKIFMVRGITKRVRAFALANLVPGLLFVLAVVFINVF